MNRRQFIKIVTATGAILWVPAVANAAFTYIGRRKHFAGKEIRRNPFQGWANWDETSEFSLATNDTFVCLMENSVLAGNETGQGGGLSGVDLILTTVNALDGALGSPPKRHFDRINDNAYMTMAAAAVKALLGAGNTWTIIFKCYDVTVASNNTAYLELGDANNKIIINPSGYYNSAVINGVQRLNNTNTWNNTAERYGATNVYVCAWSDGSEVSIGIATGSKPTKKSDFAEIGTWVGDGDMSGMGAAPAGVYVGTYATTPRSLQGYAYYLVISKTCLINNAA